MNISESASLRVESKLDRGAYLVQCIWAKILAALPLYAAQNRLYRIEIAQILQITKNPFG